MFGCDFGQRRETEGKREGVTLHNSEGMVDYAPSVSISQWPCQNWSTTLDLFRYSVNFPPALSCTVYQCADTWVFFSCVFSPLFANLSTWLHSAGQIHTKSFLFYLYFAVAQIKGQTFLIECEMLLAINTIRKQAHMIGVKGTVLHWAICLFYKKIKRFSWIVR